MTTLRICPHCSLEFEPIDMVFTWTGLAFVTTCAACNRLLYADHATKTAVAATWWRATHMLEVTWQEAVTAFRDWTDERSPTASAVLSTNVNMLVRLLSRALKQPEPVVMREVLGRCQAASPPVQSGTGSSDGRGKVAPSLDLCPSPAPMMAKTSPHWPARDVS